MDETAKNLRATLRGRKVADARYLEAIKAAKEMGWSNCRIAREVGLSEAAIRFYLRRNAHQVVTSLESVKSA